MIGHCLSVCDTCRHDVCHCMLLQSVASCIIICLSTTFHNVYSLSLSLHAHTTEENVIRQVERMVLIL